MAAIAERLIPGQPAHADPFRLCTRVESQRANRGAFDNACHHLSFDLQRGYTGSRPGLRDRVEFITAFFNILQIERFGICR
jgi:hypothetical protein